MIIYFYDLKFKNKKEFNRQKRRFYYNLNKLGLNKKSWFNKSVVIIDEKKEKEMDEFFKNFKKKEKELIVYKILTEKIEELE